MSRVGLRSPSPALTTGIGRRARRAVRGAIFDARSLTIRAGLAPYRPILPTKRVWEESFSDDSVAHFADLEEMPRYSVLIGYLLYFGGAPDVLDVGCGAGVLRERLPECAFGSYVGVDPTGTAIELARAHGFARSRFVAGDPLDVELPQSDMIFCLDVLYMVPRPVELIDRLHETLRPGGKLLVSMWRHPGDELLWNELDARFARLDAVTVVSHTNPRADLRGWRLACFERAGAPDPR
jgi:2-polyprenyl-6-hydroxyphenyl methylase/3-demethylubiquinone-9 3-methyltransferase